MTMADATLARANTMIGARRFEKNGTVRPSTAANATATYSKISNSASAAFQIAVLNSDATRSKSSTADWESFLESALDAANQQRKDTANAQHGLNEAISQSNHDQAIEIAKLDRDRTKALSAAQVVYVGLVASADETHANNNVQYAGNLSVADAEDLRQYYVEESTSFHTAATQWHSVLQTPWSALHVAIGVAEKQWAHPAGTAAVTLAGEKRDADTQRHNARSALERSQRDQRAALSKTRRDAIADQRYDFVVTVVGVTQQNTTDHNDANLQREEEDADRYAEATQESRDFLKSHKESTVDAESSYQIAMINLNLAYNNASISARAAMGGSIRDSEEDWLCFDSITEEQHLQNISDAVDAFNDAMQAATDAYNESGRAASEEIIAARTSLLSEWRQFIANHPESKIRDQASQDEKEITNTLAESDAMLASNILTAKLNIINARAATEKQFITSTDALMSTIA